MEMKTVIIIIVIIGLAAVAGPIIVGIKSFDGTVTENPYEKGLIWDEVQNKKHELGWEVELREKHFTTGDNDISISIRDKSGRAVSGSSVSLMISRPSSKTYDRYFDTIQTGEGVFASHVHFPLFGYWNIEVKVTGGEDALLFEKRIFVSKGGNTGIEYTKEVPADTEPVKTAPEQPDPAYAGINMQKDCLINTGACIKDIEREGIKVLFDIHPKPVSPMRELIYTVTLADKGRPVTDASVTVDLTMPGMFMGINRPVLAHTVNGTYEGKGVIQPCPHGGKTWMAEVRIMQLNRTVSAGFTFEVK